jgi:hypothetical protein
MEAGLLARVEARGSDSELELRQQTSLAKERRPVTGCRIRLGQAADEAVAGPARRRRGIAMQRGELRPEHGPGMRVRLAGVEPLEQKPSSWRVSDAVRLTVVHADHVGYAHRTGRRNRS